MGSGKARGIPFVISAPSGGGKTSIYRGVQLAQPGMLFSVSATTRPPRAGELDGADYHFYDEERFAVAERAGEFIETADVHGYRYGTPRRPLEEALAEGRDIVLDIDVQGGASIRQIFADAVLIFIVPPSMRVLRERLERRRSEEPAVIERRLANARREMSRAPEYDYLIVNDVLERAVAEVLAVLQAERNRLPRKLDWLSGEFPEIFG